MMTKPLILVPPCASRWPAIETLLADCDPALLADLRLRIHGDVPGASDALGLIPDGGQALSFAGVCRKDSVGVITNIFTKVEHRGRGHMRRLLQALIEWFSITGGTRLYLVGPASVAAPLSAALGFQLLHQADNQQNSDGVFRRATDAPADLETPPLALHSIERADWPLLVDFFQRNAGPDPRVPLNESAVWAFGGTLKLLQEQDDKRCRLLGAFRGESLVGYASLATDQLGGRTYAVIAGEADAGPPLRAGVVELGRQAGYERLDFPMDQLAAGSA